MQAIRLLAASNAAYGPMAGRQGPGLDSDGDGSQRLPGRQRISIAGILNDAGPQYSSSQERFSQALHGLSIAIDEEQLAEILVLVIPKAPGQHDEPNLEPDQWNLDVVANVLAQECRSLNLNWSLVAQRLDQPKFEGPDRQLLIAMTDASFPASCPRP